MIWVTLDPKSATPTSRANYDLPFFYYNHLVLDLLRSISVSSIMCHFSKSTLIVCYPKLPKIPFLFDMLLVVQCLKTWINSQYPKCLSYNSAIVGEFFASQYYNSFLHQQTNESLVAQCLHPNKFWCCPLDECF